MKAAASVLLFVTATAFGEVPVERVADDARAIDRIAEMSRRDLPKDLLVRLVRHDIDLLRGKRPDDSYEYATYEALEGGRDSESFSIQPTGPGELKKVEMRGGVIFRVVLSAPSRRLVVAKNRPLWIERVEVEYVPQRGTSRKTQTTTIGAALEPGQSRQVDLQEIARSAVVRVFVRAEKESGYGNLTVTLLNARIFDDPASPYARAVESAKALLKAVEGGEVAAIRSVARRLAGDLPLRAPTPALPAPVVPMPLPAPAGSPSLAELQAVEDLLTGTEAERREGMDRLHQLIRRMRSGTPE